jgi:hypothetical protein
VKARREAGATHSFRLSRKACLIVDRLTHPRSLGGKSALISDAITWYFQHDEDRGTWQELDERCRWWVRRSNELESQLKQCSCGESAPQVSGWRATLRRLFRM